MEYFQICWLHCFIRYTSQCIFENSYKKCNIYMSQTCTNCKHLNLLYNSIYCKIRQSSIIIKEEKVHTPAQEYDVPSDIGVLAQTHTKNELGMEVHQHLWAVLQLLTASKLNHLEGSLLHNHIVLSHCFHPINKHTNKNKLITLKFIIQDIIL